MHSDGQLNSMTPENRKILGLEDSGNDDKLNREDFVKEFQEINNILKELGKEVLIFKV
jgi:hypothetical protein